MTIKAIELEHVTKHIDGTSTPVLLSAYKKLGSYRVAKGSNRVKNEAALKSLDDVHSHIVKGFLVRMRSEIMTVQGRRRRIEGLYACRDARIVG